MLTILVNVVGLAAVAGVVLFFWGPRRQGYRAALSSSGCQEALVLVKGGYNPDTIVVRAGRPVRLTFRREESSSCSEMVVFGDLGKSVHLPEGEATPVELAPARPGTYQFTCQIGMLRGKLVVEP